MAIKIIPIGMALLAVAVIGFIGSFIPRWWGGIIAMVFGVLGFLGTLINIIGIQAIPKVMGLDSTDIKATTEIGIYITLLGFIILLIGGIIQVVLLRKAAKAKIPPPPVPTFSEGGGMEERELAE